jgi:Tol biopolymer transport system component
MPRVSFSQEPGIIDSCNLEAALIAGHIARLRRRAAWICAACGLVAAGAAAQIADVRQGTNIAVALSPAQDSLVVDLMGGLWRMPASGGGATALVPSGEGVRNPRFDPGGRSIVMQRWMDDGQWDLWLYELDTGDWRALTDTTYHEREPEFSADGQSVMFAANATGRFGVWVLDLRDGAIRQLIDEPGDSSFPSVSDRGDLVYVNHDRGAATLRLYTGRTTGTEIYRTGARVGAPSWRPGGRVLVFNEIDGVRTSALKLLLLADEPVLKTLTRAEDVFVGRAAWPSAAEIIYAADGQIWRREIGASTRAPLHLFAGVGVGVGDVPLVAQPLDAPGPHPVTGFVGVESTSNGDILTFAALGDIWLAQRREPERLTNDPFVDTYPSLSPSGDSLVFVSDRGGNMDLWLLRLADRVITQLTGDAAKPFYPSFDPSGRRVAYLETDGLGPWAASALKVLDIAQPYRARTIATGLYDARDLRWVTASADAPLQLEARRGEPSAPPIRWTFATDQGPSSARGAIGAADPGPASFAEALDDLRLDWVPERPAEPYVVQVGRLFDGVRNEYLRHMDIHVEGQRITAIVRRGLLPLPERVVDATDATMIPGLIDVHAHHSAITGERLGRMWLASGVTTVREVGSEPGEALERAESWASGRRPGPRLVVSPLAGARAPASDGGPPVIIGAYEDVSPGFAHVIELQRQQLGLPAAVTPHARAALPASTAAARLPPLSTRNISYQDALASVLASQTTISTGLAAASGWSPDTQRSQGRAIAAVIAALFSPGEQSDWGRSAAADAAILIAPLQDTIGRIVRAGGRVAVGSDAPAVPYGIGLHAELVRLAEAGIPNDQVLRLASAGGALALGLDQQLGTLEAGKLADFVVLSGDPLARIGDAATVIAVVRGGTWFAREALLSRPAP